jgi:hypothetical protein
MRNMAYAFLKSILILKISSSEQLARRAQSCIATDYRLDGWCSISSRGNRFFLFSTASRPALGPIGVFFFGR